MLREYFVFINIIIRSDPTTPGGVPSQPASETVPRLFTTGGLFSAQTIRPEICPERTSETRLEEESVLDRCRGDSKAREAALRGLSNNFTMHFATENFRQPEGNREALF